jgi:hypothetical protein
MVTGRAIRILALAASVGACASPSDHANHSHDTGKAWRKALARAPLAVNAAFDARGRLWQVAVQDGFVLVRRSEDGGRHFNHTVPVNPKPERIAADGENRPKIAFTPDGTIYVSYTQHLDEPFAGHVRLSRSTDGGRTFAEPVTVNTDTAPIGHRFDALQVDARGDVHLLWLDKRDQVAARSRGEPYAGAALYHAVVSAGALRPTVERRLADHSCECCRVALAIDTDGTPVALWRHVYEGNIRDHALQRLDGQSPVRRATFDNWKIDACPHHGPTLAIDAKGVYHVAGFTGANGRAGLYYVRSADRGASWTSPLAFGNARAQAAHPFLLATPKRLYLAWKEFDGKASVVMAMHSTDRGASWSAPQAVARSASASDHPLLIADGSEARAAQQGSRDRGFANGGNAYLSWNTAAEGLRLTALP